MWETWVRSLGREDPLEKEMATHSSILAWKIPWTEEPCWPQSMGLQRVRHDFTFHFHQVILKHHQLGMIDLKVLPTQPTMAGLMQSRCVCASGRSLILNLKNWFPQGGCLAQNHPALWAGSGKLSPGVRHLGMVLDLVRMASLLISSSTVLSKLFSYL